MGLFFLSKNSSVKDCSLSPWIPSHENQSCQALSYAFLSKTTKDSAQSTSYGELCDLHALLIYWDASSNHLPSIFWKRLPLSKLFPRSNSPEDLCHKPSVASGYPVRVTSQRSSLTHQSSPLQSGSLPRNINNTLLPVKLYDTDAWSVCIHDITAETV